MQNYSNSYNQSLYQRQTFYEQTQFDIYLKYTIDTDMQNVFGICMEYLALLQHQPNNAELLSVFKNRMILQYNLSNTIHNDLQENSKTIGYKNLGDVKEQARRKFQLAYSQIKGSYPGNKQNEAFQILDDYYSINLHPQVNIQQKELEQNGVQYHFNDKVVQQLITAMQQVDSQYENLSRQQQYRSVEAPELITKAYDRYEKAKNKISQIKFEQRQLIPSNYPEAVKKLFGFYYLYCLNHSTKLESDFQAIIFNLRVQKQTFAAHCLTDFCQYLQSPSLQEEIQKWVLYINYEGGQTYYLASQKLIPNDEAQLKQFVKDCQNFVEDYGQKKTLVEIIQLILKFALSIIKQDGIVQGVSPLSLLDLNTRDQVGTQFEKLQGQFKSSFMKEFCRDVVKGSLKDNYNLLYEYPQQLNEDSALIQRLVG